MRGHGLEPAVWRMAEARWRYGGGYEGGYGGGYWGGYGGGYGGGSSAEEVMDIPTPTPQPGAGPE